MVQNQRRSSRNILMVAGLICCAVFLVWMWKSGFLSSQQQIEQYIRQFGPLAPLVFIAFQALQVVIPILPGGLGCLVGVLMFGAWKGFLFNYIGICAGSVAAFLLARKYGIDLVKHLFSEFFQRYQQWTGEDNRFARLFAIAIFLPVAPDDFLCFLAGTTTMSLKLFTMIILLGKPAAISLYSLGLTGLFNRLLPMFAG